MSAHPALEISDVLNYIFEKLTPADTLDEDGDRRGRQTLARLARVCVAFYEPAMRLLWRRLDSVHPLFSALTSYVKVDQYDTEKYVSNLRRSHYFDIYLLSVQPLDARWVHRH